MMYRSFEDCGDCVRFSTYDIINGVSTEPEQYEIKHRTLKPCPHCGGKAEITAAQAYYLLGARVSCKKCGCSSPTRTEGKTLAVGNIEPHYTTITEVFNEIVSKWNTRFLEQTI